MTFFEMGKAPAAVYCPDLAPEGQAYSEVNVEHPLLPWSPPARTDPDWAKKYAEILLNQAMLVEPRSLLTIRMIWVCPRK